MPLPEALQGARARAPGASLVVVDDAPSTERLRDAVYGGARGYLPRAQADLLGRVAASRPPGGTGESLGVKIVETLTSTAS